MTSRAIYSEQYNPLSSPAHSSVSISNYARRAFTPRQWDLEYILWQIVHSCKSPTRLYKLSQTRKATKYQWARDDPTFLLVLCLFLSVNSIAYGVAYGYFHPFAYIWLISQSLLGFIGGGVVISSVCWYIANKYLVVRQSHSSDQQVEWLYAFDIFCNAYVPILIGCYGIGFLLLPIITVNGYFGTIVGNLVFLLSIIYHWYITFRGYLSKCSMLTVYLLGCSTANVCIFFMQSCLFYKIKGFSSLQPFRSHSYFYS
jgi:UNC-50 family